MARIEPHGLVEIRERAVEIALAAQREPAIEMAGRGIRRERERRRIVGDRALGVALGVPGVAAADEGARALRVEADRLVEIRDGAVVLAALVEGVAAIRPGARVVAVEPDRLVVVRDRRREVAAGALRDAAVVVDDGAVAFVVAVRGEQGGAGLDLAFRARRNLGEAGLLGIVLRAGRHGGEREHQRRRERGPPDDA